MKIKFLVLFLFGLSLIVSCRKDNVEKIETEVEDEFWIELRIPEQKKGVSAIYGSIEDTLVIATHNNIYQTTNQGKSWVNVYNTALGISGFSMFKGELLAHSNFGDYASSPFLFSLDHGKTWSRKSKYDYLVYDQIRVSREVISINDQNQFKIKSQPDKINDEDYNRPLRQPDKLIQVYKGNETLVYFPYERDLNCLYLDVNHRIYIGAEGTQFAWSSKNNVRTYPTHTDAAIIYISKLPVGQF